MSHFGALVLADEPVDRTEAEDYCQRVLAPYDENLEVEEHEVECHCVGWEAKVAAREEVEPQFVEERDRRREAFRQLGNEVLEAGRGEIDHLPWQGSAVAVLPESRTKEELQRREQTINEEWEAFVVRWKVAEREVEKAHPLYGKPDPECEDCGGSGRHKTRMNPRGYWDWWVVGGRWTGAIDPDYDPSADERNYAPCTFCRASGLVNADGPPYHAAEPGEPTQQCHVCQGTKIERTFHNAPIQKDVRPLSELPEALVLGQHFYAVVTPDGEWHQQGRMGWFGMSNDDMDGETWCRYVDSLAAKYSEATAIVVDAHV